MSSEMTGENANKLGTYENEKDNNKYLFGEDDDSDIISLLIENADTLNFSKIGYDFQTNKKERADKNVICSILPDDAKQFFNKSGNSTNPIADDNVGKNDIEGNKCPSNHDVDTFSKIGDSNKDDSCVSSFDSFDVIQVVLENLAVGATVDSTATDDTRKHQVLEKHKAQDLEGGSEEKSRNADMSKNDQLSAKNFVKNLGNIENANNVQVKKKKARTIKRRLKFCGNYDVPKYCDVSMNGCLVPAKIGSTITINDDGKISVDIQGSHPNSAIFSQTVDKITANLMNASHYTNNAGMLFSKKPGEELKNSGIHVDIEDATTSRVGEANNVVRDGVHAPVVKVNGFVANYHDSVGSFLAKTTFQSSPRLKRIQTAIQAKRILEKHHRQASTIGGHGAENFGNQQNLVAVQSVKPISNSPYEAIARTVHSMFERNPFEATQTDRLIILFIQYLSSYKQMNEYYRAAKKSEVPYYWRELSEKEMEQNAYCFAMTRWILEYKYDVVRGLLSLLPLREQGQWIIAASHKNLKNIQQSFFEVILGSLWQVIPADYQKIVKTRQYKFLSAFHVGLLKKDFLGMIEPLLNEKISKHRKAAEGSVEGPTVKRARLNH